MTTTQLPGATSIQPAVDGAAGPAPQAGRKLVFAIVSLALFMASVDQTIVATALDTLRHDLRAPINWGGWTITIYALGQIVAMPLAGKISDSYGRKRIFLIAVALFTLSSLACGFATSIYMLVPLRAAQALGGGAFVPSATGIVSDMFGRDRDRAIGMFTSVFPIGGIAGPAIGGVFVQYWTWRGIFLVNVPIGVVLLLLGLKFIPRQGTKPAQRFDLVGVCLLGGLLLSIMYGITSLGTGSTTVWEPSVVVPELVGIGLVVAFLRHARLAASPFIPIRLLLGSGFGIMNLINFLFGCSALGFGALVPLYAHDRYGISSLSAATLLIGRAVGMVAVAAAAVFALRRTGYRLPMVAGSVVVAVGLVLMALRPLSGVSPFWWLFGTSALIGIGLGTSIPASNNAILNLAEGEVAAVAGLRGMFRQSGGIAAVSVSTAILARSTHPGTALAAVLAVFSALMVACIPLMFLVVDQRGRI
ncbi:MAG TPA: MFS transporter [Jatrophihabitantaceae bacterium]|jgi:EmrB/QacA subfamily drug resistance transporter